MLVLTRKEGECLLFPSQGMTIRVVGIKGGRVRLGITAPAQVEVFREELLQSHGATGLTRGGTETQYEENYDLEYANLNEKAKPLTLTKGGKP